MCWCTIAFGFDLGTLNQISRKDADQFKPGRWIPACQLMVQWKRKDQRPVELMHKVNLIVAKPPYYCAHLYHTMEQMYDWKFYFVITQDLRAHNAVQFVLPLILSLRY